MAYSGQILGDPAGLRAQFSDPPLERPQKEMCTQAALKPYAVKITGPLLRIVGDRFPGTVKRAIVDALRSLLLRGGATLVPRVAR